MRVCVCCVTSLAKAGWDPWTGFSDTACCTVPSWLSRRRAIARLAELSRIAARTWIGGTISSLAPLGADTAVASRWHPKKAPGALRTQEGSAKLS